MIEMQELLVRQHRRHLSHLNQRRRRRQLQEHHMKEYRRKLLKYR
jgi:hypothetical protein